MNEINPIIIELLKKRGVTSEEDIAEFLSDKPKKTYDPFLLADMEAGVDLILSKIEAGERICIYGDYDADGITAISLLHQVLSHLTDSEKLSYYIPSRFDEGYGLNKDAIDAIKKDGAGLIVTVDCGSVSYDEAEHAKNIGMDIMVTDHHSITDRRADCILINPKRQDCPYPFKHLAGVGVAFKLAQAIQKKAGLPKSVLTEVLDLVALGTIGDIVPLLDENRTMVKFGLKVLNSGRRPGLKRLIEKISLTPGNVTSENVAFAVVPHINAAGRMMNARIAAELMMSCDPAFIEQCTDTLIENNRKRKSVQDSTYKSCVAELEKTYNGDNVIIIYAEDAHEGIAGIVAGKIKEKYERPTIIVTPSGENGEYLKGTGRSIEKINLYELLKTCDNLFEKFGGHAGACGFLMKKEHLAEFREALNAKTEQMLADDSALFDSQMNIDMDIQLKMITEEFADMLDMMQPFGSKNPKPVFRISKTQALNTSFMGADNSHLRFTARDSAGDSVNCVLFNRAGEYAGVLTCEKPFETIGTIESQYWNGSRRIQMIVSHVETEGDVTE